MKRDNRFLKTFQEVIELEGLCEEFAELRRKAFEVFHPMTSLEEVKQLFETSWKKFYYWKTNNPSSPYLFIGDYDKIQNIFRDLTEARINRTEFSDLLAKARKAVEECEGKLESSLSKKQEELDQLYSEFAQSTGSFQFIFDEPAIKLLIMDKLLNPQIEEDEEEG